MDDIVKKQLKFVYKSASADSHNQPIEIEARWKAPEIQFQELLKFYTDTNLPRYRKESVDTLYITDGTRDVIRESVDTNTGEVSIIKKELIKRIGQIAISRESPLDMVPKKINRETSQTLVRQKDRWTFCDVSTRIEFTKVGKETMSYEIEVEVDSKTEDKYWLNRFDHAFSFIQEKLSKSLKGSFSAEYRKVYEKLHKMVGTTQFFGALPKSLHREDIPTVFDAETYCVSLKLDGIRRILLTIEGDHRVYVFSRSMTLEYIINTGDKFRHECIFDAEEMETAIVIFDVVVYGKLDLRKHPTNLFKRMDLAKTAFSDSRDCNLNNNDFEKAIQFKKYYTKDSGYKEFFKEYNTTDKFSQNDGILFTPVNAVYSKKSRADNIYKWKPYEKQTIDFRYCITQTDKYQLLINYGDREEQPSYVNDTSTMHTQIRGIQNNDIVECCYDDDSSTFQIVGLRKDKNQPNFYTTAEDVWKCIEEPVTLTDLKNTIMKRAKPLESQYLECEAIKRCLDDLEVLFKEKSDVKLRVRLRQNCLLLRDKLRLHHLTITRSKTNKIIINGAPSRYIESYEPNSIETQTEVSRLHDYLSTLEYNNDIVTSILTAISKHEVLSMFFKVCEVTKEGDCDSKKHHVNFLAHLEVMSGKQVTNNFLKTLKDEKIVTSQLQLCCNYFNIAFSLDDKKIEPQLQPCDLVHAKQILYLPMIKIERTGLQNRSLHINDFRISAPLKSTDTANFYRELKAYNVDNLNDDNYLQGIMSSVTLNE